MNNQSQSVFDSLQRINSYESFVRESDYTGCAKFLWFTKRSTSSYLFRYYSMQAAYGGRNSMIVSHPVYWHTFIWFIFEGSVDVSFAAYDIPQSCEFELKKDI